MDEVEQATLPARVGLAQDTMVVVEVVETLSKAEGVLRQDGRFFASHGLLNCHFQLRRQQGQLPKIAAGVALEERLELLSGYRCAEIVGMEVRPGGGVLAEDVACPHDAV